MQVPKRKAGEFAHVKNDPYMTRDEIGKLEQELEKLNKVKRPRAIKEVQELAEHGDFSENHAYQMAKGRLRGINGRIEQIEEILKHAIPIEASFGGSVQIGSTVTLEVNGEKKTYTILGSQETNPSKGYISHVSPIGSALLEHDKGDKVTIEINGREFTYTILDIE